MTGDQTLPPRPDDLPEFDQPPLVEVALTAGFPPQLGLRQAHLGVIWAAFRDEYPIVQDHPPLDPMTVPSGPGFTINITSAPPLHRSWFLSPGGDKLIQIQADRFVANWRITPDRDYPRFRELFPAFADAYGEFVAAVADVDLPHGDVAATEVVYVNWIDAEAPSAFYRPAAEWVHEDPEPHIVQTDHRSLLTVDVAHQGVHEGEVQAQLTQAPAPAGHRHAGKPGWILQLTHRSFIDPTSELPATAYWHGRNAIVRTFTALTTPHFHQTWRRTR